MSSLTYCICSEIDLFLNETSSRFDIMLIEGTESKNGCYIICQTIKSLYIYLYNRFDEIDICCPVNSKNYSIPRNNCRQCFIVNYKRFQKCCFTRPDKNM